MNEETYREVNIYDYVRKGLIDKTLIPRAVVKIKAEYARRGKLGEEVPTITSDGTYETINSVKPDNDGNIDWIVNSFGTRYVVNDKDFKETYEVECNKENGLFQPTTKPVVAIPLYENISFIAPWGEKMYVKKNGYIIIKSEKNIYGIQETEFNRTYSFYDNFLVDSQKTKKIKTFFNVVNLGSSFIFILKVFQLF